MQVLKKNFQIGFILMLLLIFSHCTGAGQKASTATDDNSDADNIALEAPHKYDITFTNGDETINYSGSADMGESIPSLYVEDGEVYVGEGTDAAVITLTLEDSRDFAIDALFVLGEGGIPFPIKQGRQSEGLGSTLRVLDKKADRFFTGVAGTSSFSNLVRLEDPGYGLNGEIASYSLEFKGEFDMLVPETGEQIRYSGSGTVVIAPFKE